MVCAWCVHGVCMGVTFIQDLKKYHYYYWFAFPALAVPEEAFKPEAPQKLCDVFSDEQVT